MNQPNIIFRANRLNSLIPLSLFILLFSAFTTLDNASPLRANTAEVLQLRQDIAGYAQNFVGVPYVRAGNSPQKGFDCSGFTSYIMREFDVKVSPCSRTQSAQGLRIDLDEVMAGDLVFFGRRGHIQHVALVVEKNDDGIVCVHSTSSRGVVVENVTQSDYWRSRILFAKDVISAQ